MAIINIKGTVVEFHTIGYFYDLGFKWLLFLKASPIGRYDLKKNHEV